MPFYRVHIHPASPIFKGAGNYVRKSSAIIHSDVLHSAFLCVSAIFDRYWLEEKAMYLKFSSVYPYFKDSSDKIIYLYPKPFKIYTASDTSKTTQTDLKVSEDEESTDKKKWKMIKYFSEGLLTRYLESPESLMSIKSEPLEYTENTSLGFYTAVCTPEEVKDLTSRPRSILNEEIKTSVIIDRRGYFEKENKNNRPPATTPFSQNFIRINSSEGIGLWFIVELEEDKLQRFAEILRILGILGIGGRRVVGYGLFDFDPETDIKPFNSDLIIITNINNEEILCPKNQLLSKLKINSILALSLYHPTSQEFNPHIFGEYSSYECAVRGGWVYSLAGTTQPKKAVRMCIEGSSFPIIIDEKTNSIIPKGDVVNLKYPEQHNIWRSGLLLGIAFHNKFIKT